MPALSTNEAAERIARAVEKSRPDILGEVYAELFPEKPSSPPPAAGDIARHIRGGLEPEEIVGLWNVVFPKDRGVYYNEETKAIHYNEEVVGYAD
jgi:hypothetical protein